MQGAGGLLVHRDEGRVGDIENEAVGGSHDRVVALAAVRQVGGGGGRARGDGAGPAMARHGHRDAAPEACSGPVFEWILLDAETGEVLSEQNADVLTYPASLTKMMTLYLAFEALNQGRISHRQTRRCRLRGRPGRRASSG